MACGVSGDRESAESITNILPESIHSSTEFLSPLAKNGSSGEQGRLSERIRATIVLVNEEGTEAAPLVGQVVAERYFVEQLLGEGGMGTVYRARHISLEKKVALKVLHTEFARKQDLVDRFLLEAKAASRIRNEHVIDITDFGVTPEGVVFFAMEHLEGKDLHSELRAITTKGELLPWSRAQNIFLQICQALTAAHEKGIVHRDLKPENIFLVEGAGKDDFIKLLDFGIAKVQAVGGGEGERKLTKTGVIFGTPEYMAPEQARGEQADHRVDVYAMGCLLFQFLTGTVPFKAESFMAVLTQHMVEPIPEISESLLLRTGAPLGVLDVVTKALCKDRDQRFGSIRDFADAVESAGAERASPGQQNWTGSVRRVSGLEHPNPPSAKPSRRGRWPILAVALLLLVGGLAIMLSMQGGEKSQSNPAVPSVPVPNHSATAPTLPEPAVIVDAGPVVQDSAPTNADAAGAVATPRRPKQTITKPKTSNPKTSDPKTSDPKTSDPKTSDPKTSDPVGEPRIKDPFG